MDILEELALNRAARAENILKGFNDNGIEKAHNVGDIHPNGKWVWTQLSNGKYDWRVIKNNSSHNSGHNVDNSAASKNVSNNVNSKPEETKEQWLQRASRSFSGYDGSSKWWGVDAEFGRMRISYTSFRNKREYSVAFFTKDGKDVSKEVDSNMCFFGNSPTAAKKAVLKYLYEHYDDYKKQSANDKKDKAVELQKQQSNNAKQTNPNVEKETVNLIDSLTRTSGNGEIVYSGKYKGKGVVISRYKGDALWNVKIDGHGVLNDKSSVDAGGLKKFTRDAAFDYVVDKLNNDTDVEVDESLELQRQQSALYKEQNKTNDTLKCSLDKWLGVPDDCSTEVVGVGDKCVYKIKASGQPFALLTLNDNGEIETTINASNVQGKDSKAVFNTLATLGTAMSSNRYGDVLRAMQDCLDKQKRLHDEIEEINNK
jgi:hypothetical protein